MHMFQQLLPPSVADAGEEHGDRDADEFIAASSLCSAIVLLEAWNGSLERMLVSFKSTPHTYLSLDFTSVTAGNDGEPPASWNNRGSRSFQQQHPHSKDPWTTSCRRCSVVADKKVVTEVHNQTSEADLQVHKRPLGLVVCEFSHWWQQTEES